MLDEDRVQPGGRGSEIKEEQVEPEEEVSSGFFYCGRFFVSSGRRSISGRSTKIQDLEVQENHVTVNNAELPLFVRTIGREMFLEYIGQAYAQPENTQKNTPKEAASAFGGTDAEILK